MESSFHWNLFFFSHELMHTFWMYCIYSLSLYMSICLTMTLLSERMINWIFNHIVDSWLNFKFFIHKLKAVYTHCHLRWPEHLQWCFPWWKLWHQVPWCWLDSNGQCWKRHKLHSVFHCYCWHIFPKRQMCCLWKSYQRNGKII